MLQIIKHGNKFLIITGGLAILSWVFIGIFGLRLGRDFTGGTLWEMKAASGTEITKETVESVVQEQGIEGAQVVVSGGGSVLVRMRPVSEEEHQKLLTAVRVSGGTEAETTVQEIRFESVGPVIGQELKSKAITALIVAMALIILYIAWSFRKVSKPVSSWKYGVAAIIALMHDLSILVGIFAVLGTFFHIELDALFVSGILTLVGFSVHDTIVVFDRIRENQLRHRTLAFESVVNESINETLGRSINTSLTALLALFALFFIGGESIHYFTLMLIVGIIVGTYSSIFIASPILALWNSKKAK